MSPDCNEGLVVSVTDRRCTSCRRKHARSGLRPSRTPACVFARKRRGSCSKLGAANLYHCVPKPSFFVCSSYEVLNRNYRQPTKIMVLVVVHHIYTTPSGQLVSLHALCGQALLVLYLGILVEREDRHMPGRSERGHCSKWMSLRGVFLTN